MKSPTHAAELERYVVGHVVTYREVEPLNYSGAARQGDRWTIGQKAPGVLVRKGDQFVVEALNVPRTLEAPLGTTYFVVLRSVATGCQLATVMDDCRFMSDDLERVIERNRQAREEALRALGQGHLSRLIAACHYRNLAVISAHGTQVTRKDWERVGNEHRVRFWPYSTAPSNAAELEAWNRYRERILRDQLSREGFAHITVETANERSCGKLKWPVRGAVFLLVIGGRVSDNCTHFRGVLTKMGSLLGQERIFLIPRVPTAGGPELESTGDMPPPDNEPIRSSGAATGEPWNPDFRWPQFQLTAHDERLAADKTGEAIYKDLCANSDWSRSSWCGYWAEDTRRKRHPEGFPVDVETMFPTVERFESVVARD